MLLVKQHKVLLTISNDMSIRICLSWIKHYYAVLKDSQKLKLFYSDREILSIALPQSIIESLAPRSKFYYNS